MPAVATTSGSVVSKYALLHFFLVGCLNLTTQLRESMFFTRKKVVVIGNYERMILFALLVMNPTIAASQSQHPLQRAQKQPALFSVRLPTIRNAYIKATKDYRCSLERLLTLYESSQRQAAEKFALSEQLFKQGLIARRELDESELGLTAAAEKVDEARRQLASADTQIAEALVEIDNEKRMRKVAHASRRGLLTTTAFIRYNGVGEWAIWQVEKIQSFYLQRFGRPLPIAVLGQGRIHNDWRLDHRNALDVSLYPDSAEGQVLMVHLRTNGIPFSAFRQAIPGTATGPHINIGKPSHRY